MAMRKVTGIALALVTAAAILIQRIEEQPNPIDDSDTNLAWLKESGFPTALVERVVDGDTVIVRFENERVRLRYIGLDTPEQAGPNSRAECYGEEAKRTNDELVTGRTVYLEFDAERHDTYDRLLAYVYLADGRMVNAYLLEQGLATALRIPPNLKYAEEFHSLERAAKSKQLGLWAACA